MRIELKVAPAAPALTDASDGSARGMRPMNAPTSRDMLDTGPRLDEREGSQCDRDTNASLPSAPFTTMPHCAAAMRGRETAG